MYISILDKVVKIIKETFEKNGSHDRALRYTRNNLVKLTECIINAIIQEIGMYIKY